MGQSLYRHTQLGTTLLVALGAAVVLTAAILVTLPGDGTRLVSGLVLAILLLCIGLFYALRVEVTADELVVSFGPGVVHRRFRVADVRGVKVVRNPWYYGWGMRLTLQGPLYNVSGFDAVEIELGGDRKVRIGTDDPRGLSAAIQQASQSRS